MLCIPINTLKELPSFFTQHLITMCKYAHSPIIDVNPSADKAGWEKMEMNWNMDKHRSFISLPKVITDLLLVIYIFQIRAALITFGRAQLHQRYFYCIPTMIKYLYMPFTFDYMTLLLKCSKPCLAAPGWRKLPKSLLFVSFVVFLQPAP